MQKLSILFFLSTMCCFTHSVEINKGNLFEFLNSKQHITAQFIQTTEIDLKKRTVGGEIKANRSGQFKIEYKEPINEMISTDGEYLYKLDLELDQLDILPKDDYFTNTPISIFISEIDDLKELYLVDYCEIKNNQTTCLITPKSTESFMEKLFINFIENNLVSLRYLDSFNQDVRLKLNNISWSSFEESDLKIFIPEGIDVVYH
jgi:outer membrane lipoprotein-sorting protein